MGTTSWGIANSLGYVDGELIDFDRHLAIIKTITENVKIPVSAAIEADYGSDKKNIVENVLRTADVGVAGINIEDSLKKQKVTLNVDAPINVLSFSGLTNCNELKKLGVKRFSFGNALSDKIISDLTKNATLLMKLQDTSFLYKD